MLLYSTTSTKAATMLAPAGGAHCKLMVLDPLPAPEPLGPSESPLQ